MPAQNKEKFAISKAARLPMMVRKVVMGSCFRTGLNTFFNKSAQ